MKALQAKLPFWETHINKQDSVHLAMCKPLVCVSQINGSIVIQKIAKNTSFKVDFKVLRFTKQNF